MFDFACSAARAVSDIIKHVYFANAGRKRTEDIKTTEKHTRKTKY